MADGHRPSDALIVGDVHGCAAELAVLLDRAPATTTVLVGDLYTKGPDPAGVWRLIRDRGLLAVCGNHDARLVAVLDGQRPKDAHGHAVCAALDAEDPTWRDHLRALPRHLDVAGVRVVHASVHPSGDLARTTERDFLVRRRWPDDRAPCLHWWHHYTGDRPIVFGHDAFQGFVWLARGGRVRVMGLDSGCVYGGQLTGVRLPSWETVHVPAARAYKPVT